MTLPANSANANRANDSILVAQVNQFIAGFADGRSQERTYKYCYSFLGIYLPTLNFPLFRS
jgi:RsiW-degrading membrane proteinase PrsW (M82 family)